MHVWALDKMRILRTNDAEQATSQRRALENSIADVERRSDQLTDMRARSLITDAEFMGQRENAQRQLLQLRQSLSDMNDNQDNWFEPAAAIISFSNRVGSWFAEGTDEEKRLVIHAVGSNLFLMNRIVSIQARKAYRHIPKTPDFPKLRAFIKNIRKMVGKVELTETITAIKKLEELRVLRGAAAGVPRSRSAAALPRADIGLGDAKPRRAPLHSKSLRRTPRDRAA
jgi:hypothetical protein